MNTLVRFLNDNSLWLLVILFAFLFGMACSNHSQEVILGLIRYMRGVPAPDYIFIIT